MKRASFAVLVLAAAVPAASAATIDFDRGAGLRPGLETFRQAGRGDGVPAPKDSAGYFDYEIASYPAEGGTCPAAAARLGADFTRITGVKAEASCKDVNERGYVITVRYQAAEALTLVSTARAGSGAYGYADYRSKADCQAALPAEKDRFQRNTGLAPVVSYCLREEYAPEDAWAMRIDAFGDAARAPYLDGVFLFGRILDLSEARFLDAVRGGLSGLGADVSSVRITPSLGYSQLAVLYYAKERQRMELGQAAKVMTRGQCAEQLGLARAALGTASSALLSYCASTIALTPYEVDVLSAGPAAPAAGNAYERYDSYEACMKDRPRMEDYYRGQLGGRVLGALCGVTDGVWRAVILKTAN